MILNVCMSVCARTYASIITYTVNVAKTINVHHVKSIVNNLYLNQTTPSLASVVHIRNDRMQGDSGRMAAWLHTCKAYVCTCVMCAQQAYVEEINLGANN